MIGPELQVQETNAGLLVRLHVLPRARRSEIAGLHNGALKIRITAPPVDDAANRAIIEFFAALLGLPRSGIKIKAGGKSREKILQIEGISRAGFLSKIS